MYNLQCTMYNFSEDRHPKVWLKIAG